MFLRRVQGAQTGRARMMVEAQQTDCGHAVCFYERDSDLIGRVAAYLTAGEADAGASIVIATEEHRRVFELTLEKAGIDVEKAQKLGTYIALDASVTLSQICVDGRVDGEAFGSVVGGLVRQVARTGRPIRAYGEMVSLLWEAGDVMATIELERLWNDLRREVAFSLLCAYRSESVSTFGEPEAVAEVCGLHSAVLRTPANGLDAPGRPSLGPQRRVFWFEAGPDAPRAARAFVVQALRQWGRESLEADAELVVAELATNAVIHAQSPFTVVVRSDDFGVRVAVYDSSRVLPARRIEGVRTQSGHGLGIIAAVAGSWGSDLTSDGKVVWAEFDARSGP